LKGQIDERTKQFAKYIISENSTIRETAKKYGISKSTVHKDITNRLEEISPLLYSEVREVLDKNKAERHLRGGIATKNKYLLLKEK
jgi:sporulation transcriptional regulator SpoIIID